MIKQLSVLLQNEQGRLAKLTKTLGDAGVDMHALTTADTSEFGVIRIICDKPRYATEVLHDHDFSVTLNDVIAVAVPDHAGGLASIFELLDDADIDIEYSYCFTTSAKEAADVLKSPDLKVERILADAGVKVFSPEDLYVPDDSSIGEG